VFYCLRDKGYVLGDCGCDLEYVLNDSRSRRRTEYVIDGMTAADLFEQGKTVDEVFRMLGYKSKQGAYTAHYRCKRRKA